MASTSSPDETATRYVFTYPGWRDDMRKVKDDVVDPYWSIKSFSALENSWRLKEMRNKQQCYDGVYSDASVLRLMNEEFSYHGFDEDKEVLMDKFRCGMDIKGFMAVLEMKQQAEEQHLSHPLFLFTRKLSFSYDGWEDDREEIFKLFVISARSSWLGTSTTPEVVRNKLASMKKKQDIHDGRCDDPSINVLENGTFTYPNSGQDKKCVLTWITSGWCGAVRKGLKNMEMRQKVHDGDQSNRILLTLRERQFDYTYDGWEADFKEVKRILLWSKLEAFVCAEFRAEKKLKGMENKKNIHSGDDIIGKIIESGLFTYKGFEMDRTRTLNKYGTGLDVITHLDSMILKQQIHNGINPDPIITAIDAVIGCDGRNLFINDRHDTGERTGRECIICMENPKTHAFVPCGHLALCQECSENPPYAHQYFGRGDDITCPICRKESVMVMKVYGAE